MNKQDTERLAEVERDLSRLPDLFQYERLDLRAAAWGARQRLLKDQAPWLVERLRSAQAENEQWQARLTEHADCDLRHAAELRELRAENERLRTTLNERMTAARAERDDLRARLAEVERERDEAFGKGFEQVRRRCVAAEEHADRAEAVLAAVRELRDKAVVREQRTGPTSVRRERYVRLIDLDAILAAAEQGEPTVEIGGQVMTQAQFDAARHAMEAEVPGEVAEQDEPKRCEHGKTEEHRVSCDSICDAAAGGSCGTPWCKWYCHRRTCPGPVSQPTEGTLAGEPRANPERYDQVASDGKRCMIYRDGTEEG